MKISKIIDATYTGMADKDFKPGQTYRLEIFEVDYTTLIFIKKEKSADEPRQYKGIIRILNDWTNITVIQ